MKKKVILLTSVILLLLTGVVSAANLWGTYKGNSIIRVQVDGKVIVPSASPAFSYNNSVVIPLYQLRFIGIDYNYDDKNKTVNFKQVKSNDMATKIFDLKRYYTLLDTYQKLSNYQYKIDLAKNSLDFLVSSLSFNRAISNEESKKLQKASLTSNLTMVNQQFDNLKNDYNGLIVLININKQVLPKTDLRLPTIDSILDNFQAGNEKFSELLVVLKDYIANDNVSTKEFMDLRNESIKNYNQAVSDAQFAQTNIQIFINGYQP